MPLATDSSLEPALVLDLQAITVGNGFTTEIKRVYTTPPGEAKVLTPAVAIRAGATGVEGDAEVVVISHTIATSWKRWHLELLVHELDPDAAVQALLRDVRNALERTTGNLVNVAGVDQVVVESWTEPVRGTEQGKNYGLIDATAACLYHYRRGSV